jgi:hypothetical protein
MARMQISFLGMANDDGSILFRAVVVAALLVILVSAAGTSLGAFAKFRRALESGRRTAAEGFRTESEKCFGGFDSN